MLSQPISSALDELERARKNIRRVRNKQVKGPDDRAAFRATAMAWFHSHRPAILEGADTDLLTTVDAAYQRILSGADRNTTKGVYLKAMTECKAALIKLRAHLVVVVIDTADAVPDFTPLTAGDTEMKAILGRRWIECTKCVSVKAHLAAIVMMGGLLEALFVARTTRLTDKAPLFKTTSVPIDPNTGKPLALDKWMLGSYLQVGHEVHWITRSARDLAAVLGEFRNYVHPAKERRHGVALDEQDSAILWGVTKNLASQLLASASRTTP